MDFNEFEMRITKAKSRFLKFKKKYDSLSVFSTILAVLAPILISQTSNFILRLAGAILLIINYPISNKMDKYFREWLGEKRSYDHLRVEYFEFRTRLDHYHGLDEDELSAKVLSQLSTILEETKTFKDIKDLDRRNLKKNIGELKSKINDITTAMKDMVKTLTTEHPENADQLRFDYYVSNRYLDQLTWFYKRINPDKKELKEKDISKSVYFSFMKNETRSKSFKYISIILTILTLDYLWSFVGTTIFPPLLASIVLLATITSIFSSYYSQKNLIQKNSETTLNYLQTARSLVRLYDTFHDELNAKMTDESGLLPVEHAFVRKSESILMQENVKWSEIQHIKND